jgi:hypothetical protein
MADPMNHTVETALRIAQEAADRWQERAEKAEAVIPGLVEAATSMAKVVRAAGVYNLMNGVQLGPVVWAVKMNDALDVSDNAIDAARKAGF